MGLTTRLPPTADTVFTVYPCIFINPLKPNGMSHDSLIDKHFRFKGRWMVFLIFIRILIENSAASGLVLNCLRMSHNGRYAYMG